MKIHKVLTSIAAAGLLAAPVMAQAGTKASAAMPVRASASVKDDHKASAGMIVIGVLAVAAAAAGVVALTDDHKSDGAQ